MTDDPSMFYGSGGVLLALQRYVMYLKSECSESNPFNEKDDPEMEELR